MSDTFGACGADATVRAPTPWSGLLQDRTRASGAVLGDRPTSCGAVA